MRMFAMGIMLAGLAACGPSGGFAKEQSGVQIEAVPDSAIPTDGSIHVVKRGRFVIAPTTLFCGVDAEVDDGLSKVGVRGLGIDGVVLGDALKKMGQSTQHSDGSNRQRMLDGKHCTNNGKNVVYSGRAALNRTGEPYRLTLVVRQGDAFWQGLVERLDGRRSDVSTGFPDPPLGGFEVSKNELDGRLNELSIARDINDMSKKFVASLIESEHR